MAMAKTSSSSPRVSVAGSSLSVISEELGASANCISTSTSTPASFDFQAQTKTFISLFTLKDICEKLKQVAKKEPLEKRNKIHKYLQQIEKLLSETTSHFSDNLNQDDYSFTTAKSLKSLFDKTSRLFKHNKDAAELSFLTSKMLKTTFLEKLEKHNYPQVFEEYSASGEPGGFKTRVAKLSVSASSSPCVPVFGATASYANIKDYAADDESLYCRLNIHQGAGSVSAELGPSIIGSVGASVGASATGNASFMDFTEFGNIKDFAKTEGLSLKDPNASLWQRVKYRFSPQSDMQKLFKQEQFTASAAERFHQLLNKFELEHQDYTSAFPQQEVPLPGYLKGVSGNIEAHAGVKAKITDDIGVNLGAGISGTHSFLNIHQFIPESAFDAVKANPEKLQQIPPYLLRRIESIKLTDEASILEELNKIQRDSEKYFEIVRGYDLAMQSSYASKQDKVRLRKAKHSIENQWGAIGRHQFLQILLVSHAYISVKAKELNSLTDDIEKKLIELEKALSEPKIKYDKYLMTDIACFQYHLDIAIKEKKAVFDINLGPFSGSVSIAKRFRDHPNVLRYGEYLDINLSGSGHIDTSMLINLIKSKSDSAGIALPNDFTLSPDIGVDGKINLLVRYFKPHENKMFSAEETGWRKQFTRVVSTLSKSASLNLGKSLVKSTPPVSVAAGFSISDGKVQKEWIAPDDLIYTMLRFNRFYRSNAMQAHNAAWQDFAKLHRPEFEALFKNLCDPCTAREELEQNFDIAIDFAGEEHMLVDLIKRTRRALSLAIITYKTFATERNYQKVLALFTDALGFMVPHWWNEHTGQWGETEFIAKQDSGLKFGSKVKQALGFSKRGKNICFVKE